MTTFNRERLRQIGADGDDKLLDELGAKLEDILELRVGIKIVGRLSEAQVQEFSALMGETEKGAKERLEWLEKAYPTYQDEVKEEIARLTDEMMAAQDKASFIEQLHKTEVTAQ